MVGTDRLQLHEAPAFEELSEANCCNQPNNWKERQGGREKGRSGVTGGMGSGDGIKTESGAGEKGEQGESESGAEGLAG